jgi:L-cysteine desulfidase
MVMNKEIYSNYVSILKEELVPAMGCTEPIALAYAAAVARDTLGRIPERCDAYICGNIIKNVKSVVVPNTGSLRGIEAALAAGIVAGKAEQKLEVLASINDDERSEIAEYLTRDVIRIYPADTGKILYIKLDFFAGEDSSSVTIEDTHTNISEICRNNQVIFKGSAVDSGELTDRSCLNVKDIVEFADSLDISDVDDVISRQIEYNFAISQEGLTGDWGAGIGKILLSTNPEDIATRARARAAAGSDARMSGCDKPVVIVSGSGNQGMTASLPVIEFAYSLQKSHDELVRALVVSNLVTIHQKTDIGRLSAFCGAVSAGCGAAAGIAYINGGKYDVIKHTIVNALAIESGMVCDGAKSSCAAKIATSVDAGILAWRMYLAGKQFYCGDGIVGKGVDVTIKNVGRMAHDGMRETDKEIINIMTSL